MANLLLRFLLAIGILEEKPSPTVLALLRNIEDAGCEMWNPEVEMVLVTEARGWVWLSPPLWEQVAGVTSAGPLAAASRK